MILIRSSASTLLLRKNVGIHIASHQKAYKSSFLIENLVKLRVLLHSIAKVAFDVSSFWFREENLQRVFFFLHEHA
jgi:hypothetical protein